MYNECDFLITSHEITQHRSDIPFTVIKINQSNQNHIKIKSMLRICHVLC